jgi:acyl dehydratase
VHGPLKVAFLVQMLIDWAGGDVGTLRKIRTRFTGMDLVGHRLTCRGRIVSKRVDGDQGLVDCEIWIENDEDKRTTVGTAVVALPVAGGPVERA